MRQQSSSDEGSVDDGGSGVAVGGRTVVDALEYERGAADELDVAMNVTSRQPVVEFMEQG